MKKQQAILFDLDGTLLNTLDDLTSSVNVTLQAHGFPLRRKEEIRKFLGNGSEFLMRSALPEGTKEAVFAACLAEYQAYYKAHMADKTAPYEGILPLLKRLKESGLRLGVVSNKFDTAVKGLCERYFPGCIDAAAGEREAEGIRRKPAPDMVFTAAELQAVSRYGGRGARGDGDAARGRGIHRGFRGGFADGKKRRNGLHQRLLGVSGCGISEAGGCDTAGTYAEGAGKAAFGRIR